MNDDIQINVGGFKLKQEGENGSPPPAKKKNEQVTQINAKLHPEYDRDLIERIADIPKRDRSGVYRDALREYFKQKE